MIKYIGRKDRADYYRLGKITIRVYYHSKYRGIDEYLFISFFEFGDKKIDFNIISKSKKIGNKSIEDFIMNNTEKIIKWIFE